MTAGGLGLPSSEHAREPLRLRDALSIFVSPAKVFARVEDTGAYGWALFTLLVLVLLVGFAQVQTGLIDQDVARRTELKLAELEKNHGQLLDRVELSDRMESIRKEAEFTRLLSRLRVIIASPVYFLASFLLISSLLYAVVALTGVKPEYHTLMSICVYAGFVELTACVLQLAMVLYFRTSSVDTSLGMLAPPGKPSVLYAFDPFRIWFWVLVALGLSITHQLRVRTAVASCALFCLVGIGARMGLAMAQ